MIKASALIREEPVVGRKARHGVVSSGLASLTDSQLTALLDGAMPAGVGIGGATWRLAVEGVPVFAKAVPLTDLERRAEHVGSTANVFRLPMFYQYGVGSTGFGAWREVAVHALTTGWVLAGRCPSFPILYHWRVLPSPPRRTDAAELEASVARWDGSAAVRDRLTAISESSASVVLFLEHIPERVDSWLRTRSAMGDREAVDAYSFVDRELRAAVRFMGAHGLLHFDAHFHNVLTDGRRLYFADFGLALWSGFQLAAEEGAFLRRHATYDRCYTVTHLCHWLVHTSLGVSWADCHRYVRDGAAGGGYPDLPAPAASIVARDARIAVVMGEFFDRLLRESKSTPYPAGRLRRAMIEASPK